MKEIKIEDFKINPFTEIGKTWMVVASGTKEKFNCMTASWGSLGALWGKGLDGRPTATLYIRPSRYTNEFLNANETFSISFFPEEFRKDLLYLGAKSGRDENKLAKTHLHSDFLDETPIFEEAKITLICKKIYKGKIFKEGFIEKEIIDEFYKSNSKAIYNNESFHDVYVGEILKIYEK